jgi:nucleoid DNA-binding protein
MSMTKPEIVKVIANSAEITLKAAEKAVNTLTDLLVDEVKTEGRFALFGVGVFTRVTREARARRNPKTGETVQVPEKKAVKFRPAASFKEALNG